jgi:Ca2+-binding EF-hand superfamily protein
MRRQFLIAFVLLVLPNLGRAEVVELHFPSPTHASVLAVQVTVGAEAPDQRWQRFVDELFRYLDVNDNGFLDPAELKRAFPLPLPNGSKVTLTLDRLDSDRNGTVSPAEFSAHLRNAGFRPVVVRLEPPRAERLQVGTVLFQNLDLNSDRVLSADELTGAPRLLRRFDENEDEIIVPSEVQADPIVKAGVTGSGVTVTSQAHPKTGTARLQLTVTPSLKAILEPADSTQIRLEKDQAGAGSRLVFPGGICLLATNLDDRSARFNATRGFYEAQFKAALASKKTIAKSDVANDLTLRSLLGLFDAADRDGDGKLTFAELTRYLDLLALGVGCQITLVIDDHGQNLFDLLDTNQDDKLDLAELKNAQRLPRLLKNRSSAPLTAATLPNLYRLRVVRGAFGSTFGPLTVSNKAQTAPVPTVKATGLAWFRAMDRNGDNLLSPREFLGPPDLFRKLDLDADGLISAEEAAKAKQE